MPRTMDSHDILDKMIPKLEEILHKLEELKVPLDSQPISYADLSSLNVMLHVLSYQVAGVIVEYQSNFFGSNGFLSQLFKMNNTLCDFVVLVNLFISRICITNFWLQ
jgi:hypothetical protein